jgi:hypothetical protein
MPVTHPRSPRITGRWRWAAAAPLAAAVTGQPTVAGGAVVTQTGQKVDNNG